LHENGLIYKTNREVYQTAEYVDSLCSVTAVYCGYKGIKNLLLLTSSLSWTPVFAAGWLMLAYIQTKYLMAAYLNNVYLIDEMHICGP
jgi:hypothetical protein